MKKITGSLKDDQNPVSVKEYAFAFALILTGLCMVVVICFLPSFGYFEKHAFERDRTNGVIYYNGHAYYSAPYEVRKFVYDDSLIEIDRWHCLGSNLHYFVDDVTLPCFIYEEEIYEDYVIASEPSNLYFPPDWDFTKERFSIDGTNLTMSFATCLGGLEIDSSLNISHKDYVASFTWRLTDTPELYNHGNIAQNDGIYYFFPWSSWEAYRCTEEFLTALNDAGIVDVSGVD